MAVSVRGCGHPSVAETRIIPPKRETIETTLSGNPTDLRPSLLGRLLPTASHFRTHPGPWLLTPLAFLAAALAVFEGAIQIAGSIMLLGMGVPLGLTHLDYWIRYGGVEYRLDPSTIVAADTPSKPLFGGANRWLSVRSESNPTPSTGGWTPRRYSLIAVTDQLTYHD